MHLRALLFAVVLFAAPVACSKVPVGAADLTAQPVAGPVCSSLEDLQAMFTSSVGGETADEVQASLTAFNEAGGRHCVVLYPTMVEKPEKVGIYTDPDGVVVDIYSFVLGEQTFFIGLISELTYA